MPRASVWLEALGEGLNRAESQMTAMRTTAVVSAHPAHGNHTAKHGTLSERTCTAASAPSPPQQCWAAAWHGAPARATAPCVRSKVQSHSATQEQGCAHLKALWLSQTWQTVICSRPRQTVRPYLLHTLGWGSAIAQTRPARSSPKLKPRLAFQPTPSSVPKSSLIGVPSSIRY